MPRSSPLRSGQSPLQRLQRGLLRLVHPLFGPLTAPLLDRDGPARLPELQRLREHFQTLNQDRPLTEYEFTVLDTELTGFSPRRDEIVSVGAVRIRNLRIDPNQTFFTLVRPRMDLPRLSTLVHHITPGEVVRAPRLEEILPDLVEFCGTSLLVGHHVGLDMSFLNRALRREYGAGFNTPCLDTMQLARAYEQRLWEGFYDQFNMKVSYHLPDLAEAFGLPAFTAHHALADALQTAYLFLYLARKLFAMGQAGPRRTPSLRDLHRAAKPRRFV